MTALALSADDRAAFSVAKDGSICQLDIETCKRCAAPAPLQPPRAAGALHPYGSRRPTSLRQQAPLSQPGPGDVQAVRCGRGRPAPLRQQAPCSPARAGAPHPCASRRPASLAQQARYAPAAPGACPCPAAARRTPFSARGSGGAPTDAPEPAAAADWVRRLPRGHVRPGPAAQQPLMGGSNLFTPVGAAWRPSYVSICMAVHALYSRADTEGLVGCLLAACGADARQLARTCTRLGRVFIACISRGWSVQVYVRVPDTHAARMA